SHGFFFFFTAHYLLCARLFGYLGHVHKNLIGGSLSSDYDSTVSKLGDPVVRLHPKIWRRWEHLFLLRQGLIIWGTAVQLSTVPSAFPYSEYTTMYASSGIIRTNALTCSPKRSFKSHLAMFRMCVRPFSISNLSHERRMKIYRASLIKIQHMNTKSRFSISNLTHEKNTKRKARTSRMVYSRSCQ
ncbi:hypothetical protein C8J57DRAFT_1373590, partial [Mycena rebaudengoi]